ncbi:MAG: dephospho-CoA kinase [Anaerolineae bacterium]|nr:dephospho-CoA kinase [Anaerolineae bacterium]
MRPLVIGLTGPIGSGKSHVRNVLVSLGAEGIDADLLAHQVIAPDGPAFEPVLAAFGRDLLGPDGTIDRRRLAAIVFSDAQALARLEAIVHPAVSQAVAARIAASTAPAVVIEAIKLLESGLSRALCDEVWVTQCTPRQQLARLKKSRGMSAEEVRRRLAHQMPAAEMAAQAGRVIDTRGTMAETALKVLGAWVELGLPLPSPVITRGTLDHAEGTAAVLNSIVLEGGRSITGRTFTPAEERAYLRGMPRRSFLTVAFLGRVLVGFQVVEPYATYTHTMDHVAGLGTYVVAPARGRGIGRALSAATWDAARAAGFRKFVITVREDNLEAQSFYRSLGFQPCGRLARQAFVDGRYVDELLFELFLE